SSELLECVLADCFEHPVPVLSEQPGAAAEEALVEQRGERVEVGVADGFGGLQRAAPAEDAEPCEEPLLVLVEQVVGPGDRRPERRGAFLRVARAPERVEPPGEAVEERLRSEQLGPSRGELEREREAVEPLA